MEIKNPKFCIDCQMYSPKTDECQWLPTVSLVTGKQQFRNPYTMRLDGGQCGIDAKHFYPRFIKDADLDDLSTIPFGR